MKGERGQAIDKCKAADEAIIIIIYQLMAQEAMRQLAKIRQNPGRRVNEAWLPVETVALASERLLLPGATVPLSSKEHCLLTLFLNRGNLNILMCLFHSLSRLSLAVSRQQQLSLACV